MFDNFDIQLFADENVEIEVDTQGADNSADEKIDIPEELSDISEDIARDILREHADKSSEGNNAPAPAEEFDAEGNYTGNGNVDNVKIAYSRFKETLDKQKDAEKQLAAYRARFGDLNAQSTTPQNNFQPALQQDYQQQVQQNIPETPTEPPQPRYFSADDAKQIDDAITQMTMQMTGLTQEDVDNLDYLDDDDPKIGIWNHARELAKIATYNQIVAMQQRQAQEEYYRAMTANQSQSEYNDYVNQQKAVEYFDDLQKFAASEFYQSQSDVDKQIIYDANLRIEHGNATPTDRFIVRDFFTRAKYAYDAKNQQVQRPATHKKTASKPQFPRTDKVNGIPGNGGGNITNAALAEMVKNTDWDKIPQYYKDILLNSQT